MARLVKSRWIFVAVGALVAVSSLGTLLSAEATWRQVLSTVTLAGGLAILILALRGRFGRR
jgi:hypothetical protein